MSLSSASGPRPPASPTPPALAQMAGRAGAPAPASGKLATLLPVLPTPALQDDTVSLSRQGALARSEQSVSTSDSAQSLIGGIARTMFGDLTSTATVAYNMISYQARSVETATVGPTGEARSAQLDLRDDASFYGIGEIITSDGQRFDFEVAVKYTSSSVSDAGNEGERRTKLPPIQMPDVLMLTGKPLPAVKFPGGLQDLFKLLSRELRTDVSNGESSGNLNMRLIRLVDQAALLAPRLRETAEADSPERARAVASAYSSAAAGSAAAGSATPGSPTAT